MPWTLLTDSLGQKLQVLKKLNGLFEENPTKQWTTSNFFKTKVSHCSNIFSCGNFAELAGMLGRVAAAFFALFDGFADPLLTLFPMRLGLQGFCTWQFQDRFFLSCFHVFPGHESKMDERSQVLGKTR